MTPADNPHQDDDGRSQVARSLLVNQAAELLGVSRRTVYNRIREGRLRTIRTRGGSQRVLVESVEALLRDERARAAARAAARGATTRHATSRTATGPGAVV